MLKDQILKTLKYFDAQDHCLTLLEVYKYLLDENPGQESQNIQHPISEIQNCLENDLKGEVFSKKGMYYLKDRGFLVEQRLANNYSAIPRLKRAKKYLKYVKYIPFIRAVALTGSEALSNSKKGSDIDLFVITKQNRIWLARVFLTAFFQIFGVRRHGNSVENRFCLNHYVTENKKISQDQNIYTAIEYVSLIPFYGEEYIHSFQNENMQWIRKYLQQPQLRKHSIRETKKTQQFLETIFSNFFGNWLEIIAGALQKKRIRKQEYILVEKDELAFHPDSKGQQVLKKTGYV